MDPPREPKKGSSFKETFDKYIAPRNLMNRFDESGRPILPWGLMHPEDNTLTWHADVDHDGKLGFIFRKTMDDGTVEKQTYADVTIEGALEQRTLLLNGSPGYPPWTYYVPPPNEMTIQDAGIERKLNRKEKRLLTKALNRESGKGAILKGEDPDETARRSYDSQIPI